MKYPHVLRSVFFCVWLQNTWVERDRYLHYFCLYFEYRRFKNDMRMNPKQCQSVADRNSLIYQNLKSMEIKIINYASYMWEINTWPRAMDKRPLPTTDHQDEFKDIVHSMKFYHKFFDHGFEIMIKISLLKRVHIQKYVKSSSNKILTCTVCCANFAVMTKSSNNSSARFFSGQAQLSKKFSNSQLCFRTVLQSNF